MADFHALPYPYSPSDELSKRQYSTSRCDYIDSRGNCVQRGAWYWWGRWVLAAVVLVIAIIILVILGCMSSRRRRKRGMTPYYGTGWMANGNNKYGQGTYAHQQPYGQQGYNYGQQGGYNYGQQGYANPPPAYGQQQPQYTGTPNAGYYAGQNEGIDLQQPQSSYQRDGVYSPPAGPPPGK